MAINQNHFGYARVGTAVPKIRVGNPGYNAARTIELMREAEGKKVRILVFPELSITGYTCKDLFHQRILQKGALNALEAIRKASTYVYSGLSFVGMPLVVDNELFNVAVAVYRGKILGVVPKSFIPTYKEFEELRWFAPAAQAKSKEVVINGQVVPFGTDLLFAADDFPELIVGAEICEDLWGVIPPSSHQALAGATVMVNLSASNELIGKGDYRLDLVTGQSGRTYGAYVYTSCGAGESSGDIVFGGHCIIGDNGAIAAQSKRFLRKSHLTYTDIDVERLVHERLRINSYGQGVGQEKKVFRKQYFTANCGAPESLERFIAARPFVPSDNAKLKEICEEIFNIQTAGLVQRLEVLWTVPCKHCKVDFDKGGEFRIEHMPACTCKLKQDGHVSIGVSGGLDSTLALLVVVRAFDALGLPRKNIHAYTLPGFGTTARTKSNALKLMKDLGVTWKEVDIREQAFVAMRADNKTPFNIDLTSITLSQFQEKLAELGEPMKLLKLGAKELRARFDQLKGKGEKPFGLDLSAIASVSQFEKELDKVRQQSLDFENEQARTRTKILMQDGFVIGTGDLSEAAVGWCTYNADQQSMYNVNASIPKTLVRFLVYWAAVNEFDGEVREVLIDITETEVSPELLPVGKDGKPVQKTNDTLGPDELRDFFMYYLVRWGFTPEKILFLAGYAKGWDNPNGYSQEDCRKWLKVFLRRFFPAQFKRSNAPDGPKVGSVSFSQRGDWRQPSDADSALWLEWADEEEPVSPEGGAHASGTSLDDQPAVATGHKQVKASQLKDHPGCRVLIDFGHNDHGYYDVSITEEADGKFRIVGAGADYKVGADELVDIEFADNGGGAPDQSKPAVGQLQSGVNEPRADTTGGAGAGISPAPALASTGNPKGQNMSKKVYRVLLRVDEQNTFMPGGKLPVKDGHLVVAPSNDLSRSSYYDEVIDSQDSHPSDMECFANLHEGKQAIVDFIELYGLRVQLWPEHGVEGTEDWQFHKDLDRSMVRFTVLKGRDKRVHSYSAFYNDGRYASAEAKAKYPFLGQSTGLAEYINKQAEAAGADEVQVDVVGLALDYCVGFSARDAKGESFKGVPYRVRIVTNATKSIFDFDKSVEELRGHGIEMIETTDVLGTAVVETAAAPAQA